MSRTRTVLLAAGFAALLVGVGQAQAPALRVQPLWPQPMPDHQVFGSITGIAVDAQDHVWVVHRGADSLESNEKGMLLSPPSSSVCCAAAPFIVEFDSAGKRLAGFGGPGQGYQWPTVPGKIAVDAGGNVWVTGAGYDTAPAPARGGRAGRGGAAPTPPPQDAQVLKFSRDGKFLLQIGKAGMMEGPDSQTTLNRPGGVAVDSAANEVYVADSGNHRIVVFDANTGAYKRSWGGTGDKPTAAGGGAYNPNAAPGRQFRDVSCVHISRDNMVYVCDQNSDRIQVFQKNGTFVKEGQLRKNVTGATVTGQFGTIAAYGSVWDLAFSSDPQQRFLYVADGLDKTILVVDRNTLGEVGSIGSGGRYPGEFLLPSTVVMDSRGNLYTGEQHHGKRVQKFMPGR
jgi:DNA-binding beta-propeller fold protein YncE